MKTVHKSITIHRPAQELYTFWRNFENLPRFMNNVESVLTLAGGQRSHWKVSAPAGTSVEWDAEIVDERQGEYISWRSLENADIKNSGIVKFEQTADPQSTVVDVELQYDPPAGVIGVAIAKLFGEEPEIQVEEDLQRFKQIMEMGVFASDSALTPAGSTVASGQQTARTPTEQDEDLADATDETNVPVGTRTPAVGTVLACVGAVFAAAGSVMAT